jgi:hypothetical protein
MNKKPEFTRKPQMSGSDVGVWLNDQHVQQIFPMGIIDDAASLECSWFWL